VPSRQLRMTSADGPRAESAAEIRTLTSTTARTRCPSARPGRVLRLERQLGGFGFRQRRLGPELVEDVELEIPAKGVLDHSAVGDAGAGSTDLDPPKDVFVDRERGPDLRHRRIVASRCADAEVRACRLSIVVQRRTSCKLKRCWTAPDGAARRRPLASFHQATRRATRDHADVGMNPFMPTARACQPWLEPSRTDAMIAPERSA
jgi:hypothetical protein